MFGGALQKARTARMDRYLAADSILLLGDGDGRFLEALLEAGCGAEIVSLDASEKMIEVAQRAMAGRGARVRFVRARVEGFELPDGFVPDLVSAHFFFDCFTDRELGEIVPKIVRWMPATGGLVVTDFRIPQRGCLRRLWGKLLIWTMLIFFRFGAGISARKLPGIDVPLGLAGLCAAETEEFRGGLIVCELWQFRSV